MGQDGHAAVVGGSMAGLLTARVLADRFERVTVIERDDLSQPGWRRGVPQARHLHVLLPGGVQVLDELLPGLVEDLAEGGAPAGSPSDVRLWFVDAPLAAPLDSGLRAVEASRPFLEGHVRDRVTSLPGVAVLPGTVAGLVLAGDGRKAAVTGVRLEDGTTLGADLVVDASGRGSRLPRWLEEHGWAPPAETTVRVDLAYATCRYRLPDGVFDGAQELIVAATPAEPRLAALQRIEDGDWLVTLAGYAPDHPPTDPDGWLAFARGVRVPAVPEALDAGERLGEIVRHRFPHYQRRHYERTRLPAGVLVTGDAVCSFSPVYGQGMTVAAVEALALRRAMARGRGGLERRHRRAVARTVKVAWELSTSGDMRLPALGLRQPARSRILNRYVDAAQRAATVDPGVALAFLRVASLLDPPQALLHPRVLRRVLRARRQARRGTAAVAVAAAR